MDVCQLSCDMHPMRQRNEASALYSMNRRQTASGSAAT